MSAGSRSVCLCVHVANTVVPGILRLYTCLFRINLSVVQYIFDVSNNHKRCQRSLTGLFCCCCCWCTNSAGPSICHQQCVVSLLCHLISSGDMIPLCGTLSEWHHTLIGRYHPGPRAWGRGHSVFGLFWSDLEYTTISSADQILGDGS